jgi:hypothetical protein
VLVERLPSVSPDGCCAPLTPPYLVIPDVARCIRIRLGVFSIALYTFLYVQYQQISLGYTCATTNAAPGSRDDRTMTRHAHAIHVKLWHPADHLCGESWANPYVQLVDVNGFAVILLVHQPDPEKRGVGATDDACTSRWRSVRTTTVRAPRLPSSTCSSSTTRVANSVSVTVPRWRR